MKKNCFVTTTYSLEGNFLVDIVEQNGGYIEAWLYERVCGVKMLMFGCIESKDTFIKMVEANAADYIDDYRIEYMEEDI